MSGKEVWFQRGDGHRIATAEGSSAYELMKADGGFKEIREGGAVRPDANAEKAAVDLRSMKKADLLAYAAERGIEVNPKATVAAIIEVIETSTLPQDDQVKTSAGSKD